MRLEILCGISRSIRKDATLQCFEEIPSKFTKRENKIKDNFEWAWELKEPGSSF